MSSPMGYEVIEHTADVGLEVWAPELEALFSEAALGLMAVMGSGNGPALPPESVSLSSPDVEALLVDWLAEVLYLFEAKGLVVTDSDVRITPGAGGEDWTLEAEVGGGSVSGLVQDGPGVKAVTYHALSVTRDDRGARARVYLDV